MIVFLLSIVTGKTKAIKVFFIYQLPLDQDHYYCLVRQESEVVPHMEASHSEARREQLVASAVVGRGRMAHLGPEVTAEIGEHSPHMWADSVKYKHGKTYIFMNMNKLL